ncbi:YdcF family protein [uncultured Microbacterium sp.]|uniref:YdcF family protein n=1 Tax=uncultured Microbacterium sp. TaxID=191216 RepID=UPI001E155798|nr:YdcF family protein [uncultured Microbacterium sp.]MBS1898236.1 YdcF family protein [Actinomycetota bacterium]
MHKTPAVTTAALAAAGAAFLLWGEVVSARASRRGLATGRPGARRTVLVLGYGNRGARANAVNRFRVRAGLRTLRTEDDVLVFSGGAVRGAEPEAQILARYAAQRGFSGTTLVETASRTTEENIANSLPLLEDAVELAIVSNALHAERARGLLRAARPELAARLIRADDYRFGEITVIKAIAAALTLRKGYRDRRDPAPR